jgi:hypothetical protein
MRTPQDNTRLRGWWVKGSFRNDGWKAFLISFAVVIKGMNPDLEILR